MTGKKNFMSAIARRHWMVAIASVGLLSAGFLVYGEQGDSDKDKKKFWDHSDNGDSVHVLPSPETLRSAQGNQPTLALRSAASVFPSSYGTGNLTYHGGAVMKKPTYYAVYWNSAVANSAATSLGWTSIQNQVRAFVGQFLSGTVYTRSTLDDYAIVGQYKDSGGGTPVPAGAGLLASLVDTKATQSSIKDSAIQAYLTALFRAKSVAVDANGIYGIYFPSGMTVTLGGSSCVNFCGYHSHFSYNGTQIKYAVFPYPDCSACKVSTLAVADMLTIIGSHEIREAVTDPGDNNRNGWYDQTGYEADDKCAWHNLYQMNRSTGLNFWVQPEYSNGGGIYPGPGCVKP